MPEKEKACVIVHPKAEHHMADILAILEQRWETTAVVTQYAGHGIEIAAQAAQQNYQWLFAYGGDGMLSEVINGAMQAPLPCVVAPLPGGTVNQWAHEIGLPAHPVEAAKVLLTSTPRNIDIGSVQVQALSIPDEPGESLQGESTPAAPHYFLLVAGLGMDAATIQSTSELSKERYGQIAFILDWLHILPELRPFPIQVHWSNGQIHEGQSWEVLISNTRRYTRMENLIPRAHVNDGLLDIRLFSFSELEHLLFHPYQDSSFSLMLPASVALELDGSSIQVADFMSSQDRARLQSVSEANNAMITFRFEVKSLALPMAIPQGYVGELFMSAEIF
ncbi:MAG: hypothetical protein NVS2B12_21890 [Ktedonobacteraceae bacterium]